ncbi:hypothetical protein A1O7_08278 [Cladophialophora yegresii CBS 114405]|uniref:Xylanolytic transcriptional activator regulatory domain-containing protein n=1 Tax=Cladophialophora yegresii CBS 114405 TaxID=1182544 RepID=W9VT90_9EURO|nr:uncharacterized protein A1O7_08278 [Cladophialophora yegresii CBS 114405]EXJ55351.1 hypothetical protein A1O7_08278 [Cladophialophora yegresii CBS 114405]
MENPDAQAGNNSAIATTQLSYFMEDEDLLIIDEDDIDAQYWPGGACAQILSEAFFHALHGIFDCFDRDQFLQELRRFPSRHHVLSRDLRRWLALANLMWAIASKWLHLAELADNPDIESHSVYYARARALGIDHRVMLDRQGLHGVKADGLLSFYLYLNGSISRAWSLVGLAIRNASCLGLHLRAVDDATPSAQLMERSRLWYSLYNLEVVICEVLGKVPSISLSYTAVSINLLESVPSQEQRDYSDDADPRALWMKFIRYQRNMTQTMRGNHFAWQDFQFIGYGAHQKYLRSRTHLSVISNRIMAQLYLPSQVDTWASTQRKITQLHGQLLEWENNLSTDLKLQSDKAVSADPRAKIELVTYYHSVQMVLFRPCLCHIRIPGESVTSKEFNLINARNCVKAAVSLIDILPDDPTAHEAHQLLPWWNLLHYLGQTLAVFSLELSMNMEHVSSTMSLTPQIQKAMSYLWCLTANSKSSYKAWRIFRQMLLVLESRVDRFSVRGLQVEAHIPAGWTAIDEALLIDALKSIANSSS